MVRVLTLGKRRELFVDRLLIDRLEGVQLKLHEPVPDGVAIRIDRRWEGPANAGIAVFRHEGRTLLYYRAMTLDHDDMTGATCVATSDDGIAWAKPALGLVARAGCEATNLIADEHGRPLSVVPWLDTRPGVPDGERIKAIAGEPLSGEAHTAFADPAGPKRLVFWTSEDGFTFRRLEPQPEIISTLRNCFDGGNTMFWSEAEGCYVLYYRWYDGEWGSGYRSVARTTSEDLMTWSDSVPMTYGGTPREQFYTNNTQPYARAPHLYLAPAARFMEGRRALTDAQITAIGLKQSHGHFYGNDCSDAVLLTSRAGSNRYDRTFMEAFIRPGLDASAWVSRTNYPLTGILPWGTDHLALYVSRAYMQERWHIERLLLRLDGFASVSAPWTGGELLTRPFTFEGSALEINYRTSAAGSVRVELQTPAGVPIAGLTLADCPEIIGDETARVVAWQSEADLSALAGQPVRLRFVMRDADLFALCFR